MRFCLLCLIAIIWTCALLPAQAKPPLNVVFIMADDLNCEVGCYGSPLVKTPQLDRLARRAARFDRAYCQYPVCNPSRVSMLSGRRPASTKVIDNVTPSRAYQPDVVFLPQHFRQHGYRTLKVGKIFHTGDQFEDPASWDIDIREDPTSKKPPAKQIAGHRGVDGVILNSHEATTWDGFVARRGVELLGAAVDGVQPFFLAIGFRRPHRPYIAPQRYFELYPSSAIPPLVEPTEQLADIPRLALTYRCGSERLADSRRPDVAASYYASVSFMDTQLGLVLDALDQRQLWDNTVVVFASDHGYHLGDHGGLWHKMTLLESGTRVPLLIAAPGQTASVVPQLVELIDLYPTLCELCHLPRPKNLEGASLVPLLNDASKPIKSAALTVVSRSEEGPGGKLDPQKMGRSVRTDRWRYTEWFDGSQELYDHVADANEYRNLAKLPQAAPVIEQHRKLLAELESQ